MENDEVKTELDLLRKEIEELKNKQAYMQAELDEFTKPTDLYIRELAREVASGNRQALKDHNKRRWRDALRKD